MAKSESAYQRDFKMFDSTIGARFPNPTHRQGLRPGHDAGDRRQRRARASDRPRGQRPLRRSPRRRNTPRAKAAGFYDKELHAGERAGRARRAARRSSTQDEHPRPNTTLERLARAEAALRQGGVVTAGNASGINDGAAALIVGTQERRREGRQEADRAHRLGRGRRRRRRASWGSGRCRPRRRRWSAPGSRSRTST